MRIRLPRSLFFSVSCAFLLAPLAFPGDAAPPAGARSPATASAAKPGEMRLDLYAPPVVTSVAKPLGRARAELFADRASVAPGGTFAVALAITLEKGWHIYWLNPGERGTPPRVTFTCAMGARPLTGRTEWPAPVRFDADGMVAFGYEGSVAALHAFEVAPDQLRGEDIAVTASVQLLLCRETCEPASAELAITVPVERPGRPDPAREAFFRDARARLPRPPSAASGGVTASLRDGAILFFVALAEGETIPRAADFYPLERGLLSAAARPEPAPAPDGYTLRLPLDANAGAKPARLRGVLVESRGAPAPALSIDVPLRIGR